MLALSQSIHAIEKFGIADRAEFISCTCAPDPSILGIQPGNLLSTLWITGGNIVLEIFDMDSGSPIYVEPRGTTDSSWVSSE
jgi:hypothetical protein